MSKKLHDFIIDTKVKKIEEKVPGKWFVLFEDSWEWMFLSNNKPDITIGQSVEIRLRFK